MSNKQKFVSIEDMARDFESAVTGAMDAALWTGSVYSEDGIDDYGLVDAFDLEDNVIPIIREDMAYEMREWFMDNINDIYEYVSHDGFGFEQLGHDFLLTSRGHGAGFWDRGLGELGERLTDSVEGTMYDDYIFSLMDDGETVTTYPLYNHEATHSESLFITKA